MRLSQDPDATWEGPGGKVHLVSERLMGLIESYYTDCGIRLVEFPGRWAKRSISCFSCRAPLLLAGKAAPKLERNAGTALPFYIFRTTGAVMHGVEIEMSPGPRETFCGINVEAKMSKRTGSWEHEPVGLTCIGCLAMWGSQ